MNRCCCTLRLLACGLLSGLLIGPLFGCSAKPPTGAGAKLDLQANFDRAYEAKRQGRNEEALAEFTKIIELDPTNTGGYFQRGLLQAEMGSHRKAVDDYTKVLELDPKHFSSYYRRGLAWEELDDPKQALADYDAAIRIAPEVWATLNARGYLLLTQGEPDKALADFDAAIKAWDENAMAYRGRGLVWQGKREWKKAIADHEAAVKHRLSIDGTTYHHQLIWLLATHSSDEVRNGKRAVELADEAVALDGSFESHAHRAAALAEVGRFEDAVAAQQVVLNDKMLPAERRPEMELRLQTLKTKMPLRSQ